MTLRFEPRPRATLASPVVQRPDWTKSGVRDPKLLWLDKNENTDPAMMAVTGRILAELDRRSVAIYPDVAPLYATLAGYHGVDPHSLVVASGSDGIIASVFRAFIEPGDRVVLSDPTYAMYPVYAGIHGAVVVPLAYRAEADGPRIGIAGALATIRRERPKLVCLPNPDSPTGTVVPPEALQDLVRAALESGALMLVDEAYHPFYDQSVVQWIADFPNLVVARTFSKAWGLTGVRLGYGVATPEVATILQKVRPNYETNQVAVDIAVRLVSEFEGEMRKSVARLNAGRDHFVGSMSDLGLRTIKTEACFSHVAFDGWSDRVHHALSEIVLYKRAFDAPCLQGFSRFSATTPELFQPVIDCVSSIVRPGR